MAPTGALEAPLAKPVGISRQVTEWSCAATPKSLTAAQNLVMLKRLNASASTLSAEHIQCGSRTKTFTVAICWICSNKSWSGSLPLQHRRKAPQAVRLSIMRGTMQPLHRSPNCVHATRTASSSSQAIILVRSVVLCLYMFHIPSSVQYPPPPRLPPLASV